MLRLNGYLSLSALTLSAVALAVTNLPVDARAQASLQKSPEAAPAAQAAIDASESNPIEIGDRLASQRRYQAAIAAYEQSPEMTARIWNKMGIAYQLMPSSQEAIRCFKESLKLNPSDPKVLNNLGVVYESLQDYGAADRMYRQALKADPHFALVYKNLGTDLIAEHKYKQGREAYEQAMALDPGIFIAGKNPTIGNPASVHDRGAMNYYIATACARAGQTGCALEYLRTALNEGFADPKKVASDSEFAALSGNPGFRKLLAEESGQ